MDAEHIYHELHEFASSKGEVNNEADEHLANAAKAMAADEENK